MSLRDPLHDGLVLSSDIDQNRDSLDLDYGS